MNSSTPRSILLFSGLSLATAAFGQTTAAPAAASAPPASDSVVRLDAFDVSATSANGYVASESTTGTRTATKIADLPFVVDVVTEKFMEDFDFFSITNELGYVTSLSQADTEGNYTLRGFSATFQKWNGFYRLGLLDRANIQSIEVIKGPNASIYGQISPAGAINVITRRPSFSAAEDLSVITGSNDLFRTEGHIDTPIVSGSSVQVANLISFDGMDTLADTPYVYQHQRSFADAVEVKLNQTTSLLLQVDWDKILANTGDHEGLFDYNSATKTFDGTLAPLALARFSQGGPNERQNREFTDYYADFEHRFNEVWSLKLSGYGYDRHNSEIYNGISNEFDPVLGMVVGISSKPSRTILDEDGGAGAADLVGHWLMAQGRIDNRMLLTTDYSQDWRYRRETALPSTIAKNLPTAQNPNNPIYNVVPDYPFWTVVTRNDKVRWDTLGFFVRDQAGLFPSEEYPDGRLIWFGGMRHDQVAYNLNFGNQYSTTAPYAVAKPGQVQHFENAAYTPASGLNFKINQNLAGYFNYSQSFQASAQSAKLGNPELPNTRATGVDYGIKGNFLNNRIQFTIGGYYVTETGIKVNVVDPITNISYAVAGGSQNSKGFESEVSYQVTDALFVKAGYGAVDPRLLNEGTIAGGLPSTTDGRRPSAVPLETGSFIVSYQLPRVAKGLSVHSGLIYDGMSYPESATTAAGEYKIVIPAYFTVELGLDYQWSHPFFHTTLTHDLGFSVDNLLNRDYVDAGDNPGQSRGFYFHYKILH